MFVSPVSPSPLIDELATRLNEYRCEVQQVLSPHCLLATHLDPSTLVMLFFQRVELDHPADIHEANGVRSGNWVIRGSTVCKKKD